MTHQILTAGNCFDPHKAKRKMVCEPIELWTHAYGIDLNCTVLLTVL